MPKKRPKLRLDANEIAYRTMLAATGQGPKPTPPGEGEPNAEAVMRGRKGGKKGGTARAKSMTKKERAASARKAARTRWEKEKS